MFPILQIGPLSVQAPALILLIGIWSGIFIAEKAAERVGVSQNKISNLAFYAGIGSIIGARLTFLLRYPSVILDRPFSALSLNPLLLDWEGGVLVGILVAVVYGQQRNLPLWKTLDAFTPMFALMVVAFGVARLAAGEGYGIPTTLPWKIPLWGADRHPTQIYEALIGVGLLALVIWWIYSKEDAPAGVIFLRFSAALASANLFVDTVRADTPLSQNGIHVVQILSWLALAVSFFLWLRKARETSTAEPEI